MKKEISKLVRKIEKETKRDMRLAKTPEEKIEIYNNSYKRYDIIFQLYGPKAYSKCVDRKYREEDVKNLIEQGKFSQIYVKHGVGTLVEFAHEIKAKKIELQTGSHFKRKAFLLGHKLKNLFKGGMVHLLSAGVAVSATVGYWNLTSKEQEEIDYASEIQEYLQNVDEFGENAKKYQFSDIQNIMYIMSDMWANTKGYGKPKLDLRAYMELDMANTEGYGVCRNMAWDFARKMNSINEDYNARVAYVRLEHGDVNLANIERKFIKDNTNTIEETDEEKDENKDENNEENQDSNTSNQKEDKDIMDKIFGLVNWGNHAVVVVDSLEDNVELVCDPTNPAIGVVKNGDIIMFNACGENPYSIEYSIPSMYIMGNLHDEISKTIKSIGIYSNEKLDYLKDKYGVDAQNSTLELINEIQPKSFYDSVRVKDEDLEEKVKVVDSNKEHEDDRLR